VKERDGGKVHSMRYNHALIENRDFYPHLKGPYQNFAEVFGVKRQNDGGSQNVRYRD